MEKQNRVTNILKVFVSSLTVLGSLNFGNSIAQDFKSEAIYKETSLDAWIREDLRINNLFKTKDQKEVEKLKTSLNNVTRLNTFDSNFNKLSSTNLFKDKEFRSRFVSSDIIGVRKIIFDMQTYTNYISKNFKINQKLAEEIVYNTYIESHKAKVSPVLMLSLIGIESSYNPKAKSYIGATGLTQVMPDVHKDKVQKYKVDLNTIGGNIKIGIAVLKEYIGWHDGNIRMALQQYNGSSKDKSLTYSNKVFEKMSKLKSLTNNDKLFNSINPEHVALL